MGAFQHWTELHPSAEFRHHERLPAMMTLMATGLFGLAGAARARREMPKKKYSAAAADRRELAATAEH